jgi:hypothetical protein
MTWKQHKMLYGLNPAFSSSYPENESNKLFQNVDT